LDLINTFISRYRKELDYYEKSAKMVADLIEANLRSVGVRAIVTSRAKNPSRLEDKTRNRAKKIEYQSIDDIYKDIVDLAGVRVALYFPGEMEKVGKIIETLFTLDEPSKIFTGTDKNDYPKAKFSGYWANHYRVRIRDTNLNEHQKRYTEARVEVQVASVLMHAWSEVEHDLVYKPLQGKLSDEEYAILDELNGLVLSGDIALERLQKAGELRASTSGRWYENHYDLAASLVELTRANIDVPEANESTIGRVDILYKLLRTLEINTPDNLSKYLKALHDDLDARPLSEQVIDQIISEDNNRYEIYENIIAAEKEENPSKKEESIAIREFLAKWQHFASLMRRKQIESFPNKPLTSTPARMQNFGFPPKDVASVKNIIRIRNNIVHGGNPYNTETIISSTREIEKLIHTANNIFAGKKKTT